MLHTFPPHPATKCNAHDTFPPHPAAECNAHDTFPPHPAAECNARVNPTPRVLRFTRADANGREHTVAFVDKSCM